MAGVVAAQASTLPRLLHDVDTRTSGLHVSAFANSNSRKQPSKGFHEIARRAPCSLWGQRNSPAVSMAVQSADAEVMEAMELEISIKGMVCESCSSRVASALQEMEEVESVKVALDTGIATLQVSADDQLDACFNQLPKMIKTVEGLGFSAEAYFSDTH